MHDVVGHSLAVILAQAESAQYLADDDTEKLKQTMATIATSARSSLQDVRQVLASTQRTDRGLTRALRRADRRGARQRTRGRVDRGRARRSRCRPSSTCVAYRVLQEMLTNAIKHGRRDRPVVRRAALARGLDRDLRIEVRNVESSAADETEPMPTAPAAGPGRACAAGSSRSADGSTYAVASEADRATFTATAWMPVRAR